MKMRRWITRVLALFITLTVLGLTTVGTEGCSFCSCTCTCIDGLSGDAFSYCGGGPGDLCDSTCNVVSTGVTFCFQPE
jgi:hypothetical protein